MEKEISSPAAIKATLPGLRSLGVLWRFSRPHTIIGSVISICTLYAIACHGSELMHLPLLLTAIIIGIGCNIFIVGINQVADVEIDRINKPYLPIPAGELSARTATIIVCVSLLVSLSLALYLSVYLFGIIFISAFIGWAYSMPPLYLRKHHLSAALAITIVRGLLVNIGGFLVFNHLINGATDLPYDVKILAAFIIVFSVVIAWFKDLPDMEGDYAHRIKTLAIVSTPRFTFFAGNVLLVLTYSFTIYLKSAAGGLLFYGHIVLLVAFLLNGALIDLHDHTSVRRYYKRFWWFFFAEYVLYLSAYL